MIYAIIILSVALWGVSWWALSLRSKYLAEAKENLSLREERNELRKERNRLENDIFELVEGGVCQQERVEMKYKEIYRKERELQKMALTANGLRARRISGLSMLGDLGDHLNPLR